MDMKPEVLEHKLLEEVVGLMEKSALNELAPLPLKLGDNESHAMESTLITIRNLHARYDKEEALIHIRSLMHRYNIQLDELLELRGLL
jgi:hypothetical protein